MTLKRMDNVLIVVQDIEAAKAFFLELGMELEGEMPLEGSLVERVVGLDNVRCEIATLRTPDGHGRVELSKFHTPAAIRVEPKTHPRIRWAYVASCLPSTTSTTSSRACAHMALSLWAKSRSTRTCTGSVSSEVLRESSSGWPRSSAKAS